MKKFYSLILCIGLLALITPAQAILTQIKAGSSSTPIGVFLGDSATGQTGQTGLAATALASSTVARPVLVTASAGGSNTTLTLASVAGITASSGYVFGVSGTSGNITQVAPIGTISVNTITLTSPLPAATAIGDTFYVVQFQAAVGRMVELGAGDYYYYPSAVETAIPFPITLHAVCAGCQTQEYGAQVVGFDPNSDLGAAATAGTNTRVLLALPAVAAGANGGVPLLAGGTVNANLTTIAGAGNAVTATGGVTFSTGTVSTYAGGDTAGTTALKAALVPTSGTIAAGSAATAINTNLTAPAVNCYKGQVIVFSSGADVGQTYLIVSNTTGASSVLTIFASLATSPSLGDTFSLVTGEGQKMVDFLSALGTDNRVKVSAIAHTSGETIASTQSYNNTGQTAFIPANITQIATQAVAVSGIGTVTFPNAIGTGTSNYAGGVVPLSTNDELVLTSLNAMIVANKFTAPALSLGSGGVNSFGTSASLGGYTDWGAYFQARFGLPLVGIPTSGSVLGDITTAVAAVPANVLNATVPNGGGLTLSQAVLSSMRNLKSKQFAYSTTGLSAGGSSVLIRYYLNTVSDSTVNGGGSGYLFSATVYYVGTSGTGPVLFTSYGPGG